MPKPDASASAVIVSGGKQYRVAPGDRILVDRLAAEPGASVKLGRVLLLNDGGETKVGSPALDGLDVDAKVLAHRRGPRIETIRYKSKKRVRVHQGGRAYLTALEIIAVGGVGVPDDASEEEEAAAKSPRSATSASKSRSAAKTAPRKKPAKAAEAKVETEEPADTEQEQKPAEKKAPARRRTKKETE